MSFYNALVFQSEKILVEGQNLWTRNLYLLKVSRVGRPHFAEVVVQCRPGIVLEEAALVPSYLSRNCV